MDTETLALQTESIMDGYLAFAGKDEIEKRHISINDYLLIRSQAIKEIQAGVIACQVKPVPPRMSVVPSESMQSEKIKNMPVKQYHSEVTEVSEQSPITSKGKVANDEDMMAILNAIPD